MIVECKRIYKIIFFTATAILSAALGLYLECFHGEDFNMQTTYSNTGQAQELKDFPYTSDGKLNLNKAQKEDLVELYGIGSKTAERIIQYREEKGGFLSIDELDYVNGISIEMVEEFKDKVCVE